MGDRRAAYEAGLAAEEAVACLLQERGWKVLERRWRGGGAELDLVVAQEGRLRAVEVKLRKVGDPVGLEAIDLRKVQRLERGMDAYLLNYRGPVEEVCLAVALVESSEQGWSIELLDNPV